MTESLFSDQTRQNIRMEESQEQNLNMSDSSVVNTFAWPKEFQGFRDETFSFSSYQGKYGGTQEKAKIHAKRRSNLLCRRRNNDIRYKNFLNILCDNEDDGGVDDIKNGDCIIYDGEYGE